MLRGRDFAGMSSCAFLVDEVCGTETYLQRRRNKRVWVFECVAETAMEPYGVSGWALGPGEGGTRLVE